MLYICAVNRYIAKIKQVIAVAGIILLGISLLLISLHKHDHLDHTYFKDYYQHTHHQHHHHSHEEDHQHHDQSDCYYCYLFFHQQVDKIPTYHFNFASGANFEIKFDTTNPIEQLIIRKIFIKGLRAPPRSTWTTAISV